MENSKIKKITSEWIVKGQDDEVAAESLLSDKVSPSVVCFLSQQMAEKYLKAYLAENNQEVPRIHQIERLLSLCSKFDKKFMDLAEMGIFLTEFYIETRYPGDMPEGFSLDDAEKTFEAAKKIKEFVFKKLEI